jgi:hypothetical protein
MQGREERPHGEQVAAVLRALDMPERSGRRPERGDLVQESHGIDVEVDLRVGGRKAWALEERDGECGGRQAESKQPVEPASQGNRKGMEAERAGTTDTLGPVNVRAGRFRLFDSMRALAALSWVLFHAALFGGISLRHSAIGSYAARLDVGVTMFFLISGFLLYRPFVRARFEERALPQVGAYAWRRFLRIVPAYWVALTVVALWLGLSYVFTFKNGPILYGLAQIYDRGREETGIGQAWTLCVEISFYAFLPLWALAQRACGRG